MFDTDVPERARHDWFETGAQELWPLVPFEDIFRIMAGIPDRKLPRPRLRARATRPGGILLFPHAFTAEQRLECWGEIARVALSVSSTTVVGLREVLILSDWPDRIDFLCDLTGGELVDVISGAEFCVGAATGLTHLASELEVPTFALWGYDDWNVFRPRHAPRTLPCRNAGMMQSMLPDLVRSFLTVPGFGGIPQASSGTPGGQT